MRSIWVAVILVCLAGVALLTMKTRFAEPRASERNPTQVGGPSSASPEDGPAPRFLIATRQVKGPFFEKSVVLLIQHNQNGALGLILNRPTETPVTSLLTGLKKTEEESSDEEKPEGADRLHVGGPVDPSQVVFLVKETEPPPRSVLILPGVYASSESGLLERFSENLIPPENFRAYVGYAGWGPGQLEGEIKRGDWFQSSGRSEVIFDPKPEHTWERLIAEHEGVQVQTMGRSTGKVAIFSRLLRHDS